MELAYYRSGLISALLFGVSIALAVAGVRALSPLALLLSAVFAFLFLVKAYRSTDKAVADLKTFVGHVAGTGLLSVFAWSYVMAVVLLNGLAGETFISTLRAGDFTVPFYAFEQIASGTLLDILEVYRLRITSVQYDATDLSAATMTLGMRLTGSLILAGIVVRAWQHAAGRGASTD